MSRSNCDAWAKRCWNGTASRKANRTCTPGSATRSSLSSSMSWRLSRSCSASSRSAKRENLTLLRGLANARQRLADQARDLHLRDPDALADLGLRHVLDEAQAQHLALPRADRHQQPVERRAVLSQMEALVVGADRVGEQISLVLPARARRVERCRAVRAGGLQRLEHLLLAAPEALGELGDRRLAVRLARHLADRAVDLERELLQVARH